MILHSIPFMFFCIAFFWAAIDAWCRLRAGRARVYAALTARWDGNQRVLQADTSPACYHIHVEPVIPSGETEPVAALCADRLLAVRAHR
jgi:hypothetical protein